MSDGWVLNWVHSDEEVDMKGKSTQIFYFERPGPVNTEKALELGASRALELHIEHLVVPSLTGQSAWRAAEKLEALQAQNKPKLVCVTFRAGGAWDVSGEPPEALHWREVPELRARWEEWQRQGLKTVIFDPEIRKKLEERDVPVIQTTDLGYEIDSSMAKHLRVGSPKVVMKETLFLICPGLKVAVFTALTAADAGAIPVDKEVVAFGGMEQGLDTAAVIKPSYSDRVFHPRHGLEIREIICKPRTMMGPSGVYYDRAWGV